MTQHPTEVSGAERLIPQRVRPERQCKKHSCGYSTDERSRAPACPAGHDVAGCAGRDEHHHQVCVTEVCLRNEAPRHHPRQDSPVTPLNEDDRQPHKCPERQEERVLLSSVDECGRPETHLENRCRRHHCDHTTRAEEASARPPHGEDGENVYHCDADGRSHKRVKVRKRRQQEKLKRPDVVHRFVENCTERRPRSYERVMLREYVQGAS